MGHWVGSLVAFTALVVFQWDIEAERFVAFRDRSTSIGGGAERGWVMRFSALSKGGGGVTQFSPTLTGWVILFYNIDRHIFRS